MPIDPLNRASDMAALIAQATGVSSEMALMRLKREHRQPGVSVAEDFARSGAPRYTWSPAMEAFYQSTDAFIYELAIWNRNAMKVGMRLSVRRFLRRRGTLDILNVGDGLGFDSLALARDQHRVTYLEFPGPSERFARLLFAQSAVSVTVETDPSLLDGRLFDAIVCLDVLEHVPDPAAVVKSLAARLRPGGLMLVSAPFALIHPAYPTHLKANRRFSGSLALYRQAGLRLYRARPFWDPIILRKPGPQAPLSLGSNILTWLCALMIAPFGLVLLLGRVTALPFYPLHPLRRLMGRWFAREHAK